MTLAAAMPIQALIDQDNVALPPEVEAKVRRSIINTLSKYPGISVSMLGSHVRPNSEHWRLVLEQMVIDGEVLRQTVHAGKRITYAHYVTSPLVTVAATDDVVESESA